MVNIWFQILGLFRARVHPASLAREFRLAASKVHNASFDVPAFGYGSLELFQDDLQLSLHEGSLVRDRDQFGQ